MDRAEFALSIREAFASLSSFRLGCATNFLRYFLLRNLLLRGSFLLLRSCLLLRDFLLGNFLLRYLLLSFAH